MPSVFPSSWVSMPRGHWPARMAASIDGIRHMIANMSAIVCSATACAFTPGVLVTEMPRCCAAAKST
jgi:hypothetical protein